MVKMAKDRTYSRYTREAAALLAGQVRLGRKRRKWTEHELAERAGISRATLQKIEKGDLSVAIGLVFEVAALVGVTLFDDERTALADHIARTEDKLALLPGSIRRRIKPIDDEF
jgi:transcriptional regulator with XRE-family HTH domain